MARLPNWMVSILELAIIFNASVMIDCFMIFVLTKRANSARWLMKIMGIAVAVFVSMGWQFVARGAAGVYQEPAAFLDEVFDHQVPKPETIWLVDSLQSEIIKILEHKYPAKRVKYWRQGEVTAFILEEIGKEEPITLGIVVKGSQIGMVKVLIFRESRGWEIRYPNFTDQFRDASLQNDLKLSRSVDGISGATLSVNAAIRLSRLALLLSGIAKTDDGT